MRPDAEKTVKELQELAKKASEHLATAKTTATEKGQEIADEIDREAHKNPWVFVAITALLTGIIGFLLGHKSSKD